MNTNSRAHYVKKFFASFILVCFLLSSLNIGGVSVSHARSSYAVTPLPCDNDPKCAQVKPNNFIIYLPWDDGVTHTVQSTYGKYLHVGVCRKDKTNDYYALDFDLYTTDNVRPIAAGKVEYAGPGGTGATPPGWATYGNMVIIDHQNGYHSLYAHLSKIDVKLDDLVNHNDIIGKAGKSGTSEIHLHFALYYGDRPGYAFKVTDKGFYGGCSTIPEPFRGVEDYEDLTVRKSLTSGNNNGTGAATSTVLVFDISGSMSLFEPSGTMKLDAAKSAGGDILDIIAAENQVSGLSDNQVSIVSFSDSAWMDMPLTTDMAAARSALSGLYPQSSTAMPAGLQTSIGALPAGSGSDKPIIILLSDGMPNVDLFGVGGEVAARQQSLDLATQAGQQGICIYTIGFGDPAGLGDAFLDESFLQQVSANSGCGSYYNAQNSIQLANVYVQVRHASTGNILLNQTGRISQGQQVDIGTVDIPKNQSLALFTLNWPGSRLDALLTDPKGQLVDSNYPDASILSANSIVSLIIQNPQAGQWKIAAQGVDVPEGTIDYNAILSVRPNLGTVTPPSPGLGFVLLTLAVAGGGVLIYALSRGKKRTLPAFRSASVSASLSGLGGPLAGRTFPLIDGMLIGRGSTCQLQLSDRMVSRQHARLRNSGSHWFIQDVGSHSGIEVNGARIKASALNNGDRIRIGSTEFEFHVIRD